MTIPTPTSPLPTSVLLCGAFAAALAASCAAKQPPPPATAQAAPPTPPGVRTPDAILADAVTATGGAAAWNAHRTSHVKLTVSLQGMGMGGPAEHFQTNANKSLTLTTLPGVGAIREGANGKVMWAQDPVNGLRLLDGAEAEQARIEAAWNADLEAHELFAKIEAVANPPAGLECLTMTPRLGPSIRCCYDRQTHLQVSQEGTRATAQGDVPFHASVRDWRTVGGVKIPYVSETQAGPVTIVTTIDELVFDEPIDDKMFEPPAPARRKASEGGTAAMSRKVILCRCEDVTLADVQRAVKLGRATSKRSSATPASAPGPARARSACARWRSRSPTRPGRAGGAGALHRPPAAGADRARRARWPGGGRESDGSRDGRRRRAARPPRPRPTSRSSAPA